MNALPTELCQLSSINYQRSWGKVIFPQVSDSVHGVGEADMHGRRGVHGQEDVEGGMHGGGMHGKRGVHGQGVCMAGDMHSRGHVWQGACVAGGVHGMGCAWWGMHGRGACVGGHV